MNSAITEVRKILDTLPADASFEDIQYHIYVCQKIERGLSDSRQGNIIAQEDVEKRVAAWLGK